MVILPQELEDTNGLTSIQNSWTNVYQNDSNLKQRTPKIVRNRLWGEIDILTPRAIREESIG